VQRAVGIGAARSRCRRGAEDVGLLPPLDGLR
jgi:hypothetical protein